MLSTRSIIPRSIIAMFLLTLGGFVLFKPALKRVSAQSAPQAQSPETPLATSVCLTGDITGTEPTTFNRPGLGLDCACDTPTGAGQFYETFAFRISGCSVTPTVTATTCVNGSCVGPSGTGTMSTSARPIIYQKSGGAVGTPASPIFDPLNPCTNYITGFSPATCSGTGRTVVTSSCPVFVTGDFFVVLAQANGVTGTYNLNVSVAGAGCQVARISSPSAADGIVSGPITSNDGSPVRGTVVNLGGAQNRKMITDANGFYRFDNVETSGFYTVTPSRVNYTFSPSSRSFSQLGNNTEATFTATSSGDFANPLDTPEYFVRQHYLDFLGREPDESGLNFWSDQILECGTDMNCLGRRRENVSAAYFLSIEFQRTGGLVDGLYRASYGVRPQFAEFMPDTAAIARDVVVGRTGWEQLLNSNKQAFLDAWVQRPAFRAAYDLLTNDRYVDSLIAHTGVNFTPSERDALVNGLTLGTLSRADVLQRIAEDERFVAAKRNEAFVMMEYFGYLRRDPDAGGFQFWLNKLSEFNGNFERAEMVKAFIVSGEYRDRFPR